MSRVFSVSISLAAVACTAVVRGSGSPRSGVQSLIAAERAFSRHSERAGITESFLANLADDGILFRPGPVKGTEWLRSRPPAPGYLSWDPETAVLSASDDLGYTTGPFELRARGAQDTVSRAGHYVTVWRRDSTGTWKVALDIGTTHPFVAKPADAAGRVLSGAAPLGSDARRTLLAQDSALGVGGRPQSVKVLAAMADDARMHREGALPALGIDAVRAALAGDDRPYHSRPLDAGVSRAGDLAYSYGEYDLLGSFTRPAERGYYLRIWRAGEDGKWRVLLDLAQPGRPRS